MNFVKLVLLTDNVQLALMNIHFGMEVALNASMVAQHAQKIYMNAIQILVIKVIFFYKII
jgi:hypothetical protein